MLAILELLTRYHHMEALPEMMPSTAGNSPDGVYLPASMESREVENNERGGLNSRPEDLSGRYVRCTVSQRTLAPLRRERIPRRAWKRMDGCHCRSVKEAAIR